MSRVSLDITHKLNVSFFDLYAPPFRQDGPEMTLAIELNRALIEAGYCLAIIDRLVSNAVEVRDQAQVILDTRNAVAT